MTHAVVITNPAAARANGAGLDTARARLEGGGLTVDVRHTEGPGHAERLAREALAAGARLLIAHGGDGTVMEVATALVGSGTPLGLLPAGTGNLLAGNLRIRRNMKAAADVILAGATRRVDVGRLETSTGSRYFTVAAGTGFDAELMHRTPSHHKRAFGIGAYVATAVGLATALTRATLTITTDGVTTEIQAATVLVANCRELIPGLLPLGPEISFDDGVLDVVVMDAGSLPAAAGVAWNLLVRRPHSHRGITFLRGRRVHISADADLPVQADGEACGRAPLSIEVVPAGLTVFAPARG